MRCSGTTSTDISPYLIPLHRHRILHLVTPVGCLLCREANKAAAANSHSPAFFSAGAIVPSFTSQCLFFLTASISFNFRCAPGFCQGKKKKKAIPRAARSNNILRAPLNISQREAVRVAGERLRSALIHSLAHPPPPPTFTSDCARAQAHTHLPHAENMSAASREEPGRPGRPPRPPQPLAWGERSRRRTAASN